jgi:hypothetical protein
MLGAERDYLPGSAPGHPGSHVGGLAVGGSCRLWFMGWSGH